MFSFIPGLDKSILMKSEWIYQMSDDGSGIIQSISNNFQNRIKHGSTAEITDNDLIWYVYSKQPLETKFVSFNDHYLRIFHFTGPELAKALAEVVYRKFVSANVKSMHIICMEETWQRRFNMSQFNEPDTKIMETVYRENALLLRFDNVIDRNIFALTHNGAEEYFFGPDL